MAQPKLLDDRSVAVEIRPAKVVQQATTTADHLQQSAAAVVILGMIPEVPGQLFDAGREQCDLHRSRPLVVLAPRELFYDSLLCCLFHVSLLSLDPSPRFNRPDDRESGESRSTASYAVYKSRIGRRLCKGWAKPSAAKIGCAIPREAPFTCPARPG